MSTPRIFLAGSFPTNILSFGSGHSIDSAASSIVYTHHDSLLLAQSPADPGEKAVATGTSDWLDITLSQFYAI
jgi:hypothetical protein